MVDRKVPMTSKSTVYVTRIAEDRLYESMRNLLHSLQLPTRVNKIAIKLNMCDYRLRETGATSDPIVVDALLMALREKYSHAVIFLVENDAGIALADILFRYLGIEDVAKKYSAYTINLAHEKWIEKRIDGLKFKRIEIPAVLEDCDLFITHPKLKTHGLTKVSCGLKNVFGCIRGRRRKFKLHPILDEAIVDINLALRPNISIVDANICHEGFGPSYGLPKTLGLLIAGKDIVAVDTFCAKLAGFRPWFIGHIRKASFKGLGNMRYDLKAMNLNLIDLEKCRFDFSRKWYYFIKLMRKAGLVAG